MKSFDFTVKYLNGQESFIKKQTSCFYQKLFLQKFKT